MSVNDLQQRFPDMQPVESAPALRTINGIGLTMYGRREYDEPTHTYLKNWCFCLFFVPVLILRTYRVADAQQGWYFLSREPLSSLSKAWNLLVVAAVVCGGGYGAWNYHTSTPGYRAGQQMAQARQLEDTGRFADAARVYSGVAFGGTDHAEDARGRLRDLIDNGIDSAPADEAAGVIEAVIDHYGADTAKQKFPQLSGHVLRLVRKHRAADARGALALLDSIAEIQEASEEVLALRESLLLAIVQAEPENLAYVSELALIYEARGEDQKCIDLLEPHADKLGDTQGARVLGQIYAVRGDIEPAYTLLKPYTQGRLEKLRAAEQAYEEAIRSAWDRQIDLLNEGKGPDSFYKQYEAADEAAQGAMVDAYVQERVKDDPAITRAIGQLGESAAVVPVALDLGIVMLGRASTMSDPDAKRAELESAEQTFLAIRGLAGETDEYRLYLGQVYYWLGKADEGKALLDELLAAHNRAFPIVSAVAHALREVGAVSEARVLIEQAYTTAQDPTEKFAAARFRALLFRDLDDEIEWLGRSNLDDVHTKAALNAALGQRASSHGKPDEAARYLREAIRGYESTTETVSTLNNAALVYLSLFEVDGEPATIEHAVRLMDKAVALEPSDSILMFNTASTHMQAAAYDRVKEHFDLVALRVSPTANMLAYLYDSADQRDAVFEPFVSHPSMTRALNYADRLMLVAPQRAESYAYPLMVHSYTEDVEQLTKLKQRIEAANIDLSDTLAERKAYYAGMRDEKYRREYTAQVTKWRNTLDRLGMSSDPITSAFAADSYIEACLHAWEVGLTVDHNELVALAERSFTAAPSSATRSSLQDALCLRALEEVSASDPALARFAEAGEHTLDPKYLVALAMGSHEPFAGKLAQHPDIQRVADLLEETAEHFDNGWGPWSWAMIRATRPGRADEVAGAVTTQEASRLSRQISLALNGENAENVLAAYWEAQLAGNTRDAAAIIEQARRAGIPLPPIKP